MSNFKLPMERPPRYVIDETGCWLWSGGIYLTGYGAVYISPGKTGYAHRWMYERMVGPIPPGMHIDHLCRVRRCVNPAHLEPVTQAENNRRAGLAAGVCRNRLHDTSAVGAITVDKSGVQRCKECYRAKLRRQVEARKRARHGR